MLAIFLKKVCFHARGRGKWDVEGYLGKRRRVGDGGCVRMPTCTAEMAQRMSRQVIYQEVAGGSTVTGQEQYLSYEEH